MRPVTSSCHGIPQGGVSLLNVTSHQRELFGFQAGAGVSPDMDTMAEDERSSPGGPVCSERRGIYCDDARRSAHIPDGCQSDNMGTGLQGADILLKAP